VNRGADPRRPRGDGRTPYAIAALTGNEGVVEWLRSHGAATELSDVDRLVAACSAGDRATARSLLKSHPELRQQLREEHHAAFLNAAERGDTRVLETMLECGFDPNRGDEEMGKTALHAAAHEGWPDAVRVLLAHGASPAVRDREFHGQPLVWAADGFRTHGANGRDFPMVARLLLEAGSPVAWEQGAEPSDVIVEIIEEWQRSASAPRSFAS